MTSSIQVFNIYHDDGDYPVNKDPLTMWVHSYLMVTEESSQRITSHFSS